jgi:hypothetical protein
MICTLASCLPIQVGCKVSHLLKLAVIRQGIILGYHNYPAQLLPFCHSPTLARLVFAPVLFPALEVLVGISLFSAGELATEEVRVVKEAKTRNAIHAMESMAS